MEGPEVTERTVWFETGRERLVPRDVEGLRKRTGIQKIVVAVATDDMAVTSKRAVDAAKFKSNVKRFWEITDHGPISWFLGFQIKRDRKSRTLLKRCTPP